MLRFQKPLLYGAVCVASALTVALAAQNRTLREEQKTLAERATRLYPGLYVPAISAATVDGAQISVGSPSPGTNQVLFVFTTTCPYCQASLPAWSHLDSLLSAGGDSSPVQVIGISLDSVAVTTAYATKHKIPFPIVSLIDRRSASLLRTGLVPQVIVIDSEGRVAYVRVGVLESDAAVDSVVAAARRAPRPSVEVASAVRRQP